MQDQNPVALREWAVICERFGAGEQILALRTGGIHERKFGVDHREFWLTPTYLHEAEDKLSPPAGARVAPLAEQAPPEGTARMQLYAEVTDARQVLDLGVLEGLASFHPYTPAYVRQRFEYRSPGVWALLLRVYRAEVVVERGLGPEHVGCVSWLRFEPALSTAGLSPVLDDEAFGARRRAILDALGN